MGGKKPRSFQFNNWQNTFKDAVQKSEKKKHPTLGAKQREGKMWKSEWRSILLAEASWDPRKWEAVVNLKQKLVR